MKTQLCLFCHLKMTGRLGKKFCDHTCRSSYHNRITRLQNESTNKIDKLLKRNRLILEYSYAKGLKYVDHVTLEQSGFSFEYFTHYYSSFNGDRFCFCYEFGYSPLLKEVGKYKILKRKL